jgi:hypothetical protein
VSRQYMDNEEQGCRVGDVSTLEVHSGFLNVTLERIRWMEVYEYDAEGSRNNGMHTDLFAGT